MPDVPLNEHESSLFNGLGGLLAGRSEKYEGALMRATFDGEPVAVVVAVGEMADGKVDVRPLAILLNTDLLERLVPPTGEVEGSEEQGA